MDLEIVRVLSFFGTIVTLFILFLIFGSNDDMEDVEDDTSALPLDKYVGDAKVTRVDQQKSRPQKIENIAAKIEIKPKEIKPIVKLSFTAKNRRNIVGFNKDVDWRKEGLLSLSGYRVGKTKGVKEPERRKILKSLYQDDNLLDVSDRTYAEEWGDKYSSKRYKKLNDSLSTFLYQAEKRNKSPRVNLDLAISQWKSDIVFLQLVR
jgi:hypothetical protein